MGDVLAVTLPVFILIGAGYLSVYKGLFSDAGTDGLMIFTQRFAIPCLLFSAVSSIDLASSFNWRLLVSYYSGSLACFAAGIIGARLLFNRPAEDAVAIGFAAMFANTVLLGLPIAERAYGIEKLDANYAIVATHAAFCYLLGTLTMEITRSRTTTQQTSVWATVSQVGRALSRNALMIGAGLGIVVNVTGLPLPDPLTEAIDLMVRAALPAALFGLGGVLVKYRPEGDGKTIALLVSIALFLHPIVVFGMGRILDLSTDQLRAAVLTASMAPGVNSYLFAAVYGKATRVSASAVLIGTAASVFTVSGWLLVLG